LNSKGIEIPTFGGSRRARVHRPLLAPTLAVLAVGLALGLSGCGSAPNGRSPAQLMGTVSASPCQPVQRQGDPPCPAVPGLRLEFRGRHRVVSVRSNAKGAYKVALAAGSYQVVVMAGFAHQPQTVQVRSGQHLTLNLVYDSGIR